MAVTPSEVAPGGNRRKVVIAQRFERPRGLNRRKAGHGSAENRAITVRIGTRAVERHFAVFAHECVLATVHYHCGHMLPDLPMLWAAFQHRHVSQRAGRIGTQNGATFSQVKVASRCLVQKAE